MPRVRSIVRPRTTHLVVAALVVSACSAAVGPDPDEIRIEIPLPSGSTKVDLSTAPGAAEGGVYPINTVRSARAQLDADGKLFAQLTIDRFQAELFCSDFGCNWFWVTKSDDVCFAVDTIATVAPLASCARAAGALLDAEPPETSDLYAQVVAAAGSSAATLKEGFKGLVLSDADGRLEWLGGASTEYPLEDVYSDWLANGVPLVQQWSVRASFVDGVLADAPVVEPSPGGVPLMPSTSTLVAADETRSMVLRTREDGLIALDLATGPLGGTFVGEGYHLPPDAEWSRGGTVGAFVVGDKLIEFFIAPHENTLGQIQGGVAGGNVRPSDLHLHVRTKASGQAATFHPFAPLHARSNGPGGVVACFDRPVDPASVSSLVATVEPAVQVLGAAPTFQPACVSVTLGAAAPDTGHMLSLSGLKDLAGRVLPESRVSFRTTEEALTDLQQRLIAGRATSGLWPLASGGVVAWNTGEPGGDGLTEWGPDLYSRRRVPLPEGFAIEGVTGDSARGRIWVKTAAAGVFKWFVYDGVARRDFTPDDHALFGTNEMRLRGDGTAIFGITGAKLGATPAGFAEVTLPDQWAPVLGLDDYVEKANTTYTHRRADGTAVVSYSVGDAWTVTHSLAIQSDDTYACTSTGIFKVDASGATPLEFQGLAVHNPCTKAAPDLDGGVWFRASTGGYTPILFSVLDGAVRSRLVRDPVFPSDHARWVDTPVVLGGRVYFWAAGDFLNHPNFPATLRLTTRDAYDRLMTEVVP